MAETLSFDAGVEPAAARTVPTSATLTIENMHCGNCIRTVEATLAALPGVVSARANLTNRRVTVIGVAGPIDAEGCIGALEKAGFRASLIAATTAPAENARDADHLRRLGVAGFAAANIMLLSVAVWSGHAADMPPSLQTLFHWLSAAIALPSVAYAGQPFFASARQALAAGRLNMDVPISLGVTLATAMSLYQTVRGSEQVYFDAAITLLFFLLVGRYLDQAMRTRAASAAENLLGVRSQSATRIMPDGTSTRIATDAIVPGIRLVVAAGERVPADGRILFGHGGVDESLISGESRPRIVAPGDDVHCGTVLLDGPMQIEARKHQEDTLIADIARLMRTAEQARGRYVRLADRAARLYAPAVHILGAGTFIGWLLAGYDWQSALTAAIAVLIITCPCALALAVPAVQVVAASRLFRHGIILKAADGLERLAEIDTIVLDKTGTLTHGAPALVGEVSDDNLRLAASLAGASRHPYSRAVVKAAQHRGLAVEPIPGTSELPGQGLSALLPEGEVRLGSAAFTGVAEETADASSLWLARSGASPIALPFEDALRADAADVVGDLRRQSFAIMVLSGDRAEPVEQAAQACGIEEWAAGQTPDGKLHRIEAMKAAGRKVLMIGDGLNDAPALAAGHASLSPSSAADISQTAADAVFQGDQLAPVLEVLAVARAAQRHAKENFAIAIGYNIVFVPLAIVGLVTPLIAAIAMSASSIAVTANALRLSFDRGRRNPS